MMQLKKLTVFRSAVCYEQVVTVVKTESDRILRGVDGSRELALNNPIGNSPAYISQHRLQRKGKSC